MRARPLYNLLSIIQDGTESSLDFFEAFLLSGRNSKRFDQKLRELTRQRSMQRYFKESTEHEIRKELRKYRLLFYKLKRDGLVAENESKKRFLLTKTGKQKLEHLSLLTTNSDISAYSPETSNDLMIIIFDIPERERHKRRWLRSVLKNLDFKMIQKSVWTGHCKVPELFLKDIQRLHLAQYIEIFKATKYGSL